MQRETVGAISQKLLKKEVDNTHSAHEQMVEQLTSYDAHIHQCIDIHKKKWPNHNFYVEVQGKKERLMPNVIRNFFIGKFACPTPTYDQTLYYYNCSDEQLQFMWVIPSKHTCVFMIQDPSNIPLEERQLLGFVYAFADGTLMRIAKERNKELN